MFELSGLDEVVGRLAEAHPELLEIALQLAALEATSPAIRCTAEAGAASVDQPLERASHELRQHG